MKLKIIILPFLFLCLIEGQLFGQSVKANQTKKFVYQTSVGFGVCVGNIKYSNTTTQYNTASLKIQQLLAYQFNSYIYMGVGAGVDIWKKSAFIPLFGNISVNFMNKNIAPHWYLNAGYAFKWHVSSEPNPQTGILHATMPGPYGESGMGIKLKFNDRFSFIFTVNYNIYYSQINYSVTLPNQEDFSDIVTNRYRKTLYHFAGLKLSFLY